MDAVVAESCIMATSTNLVLFGPQQARWTYSRLQV
jgi:hypothetical protein